MAIFDERLHQRHDRKRVQAVDAARPGGRVSHAGRMTAGDVELNTLSVRSLTRRTQRFRAMAERSEELLTEQGVAVPAAIVDRVLNHRNAAVAVLMGISARQAIWYAPDDVPERVADEIIEAIALISTLR